MLSVRESTTREVRVLDGLWRLYVPSPAEDALALQQGALPGTREVPVPASLNDLFADPAVRDHVGRYWYQRSALVPHSWAGERVILRFGSVTQSAAVFIDDELVTEFKGGYMPFEVDVTEQVSPGASFRLSVAVDNRLDNTSIPPGELGVNAAGKPSQEYKHDFYNYAGIHRSVYLYTRPHKFIEDVTVSTDIEGGTGVVNWSVEVKCTDDQACGRQDLEVTVLDEAGNLVAEGGSENQGSLRIADATFWTPGVGGMYQLRLRLLQDGEVRDEYIQPFGIRTVEVREGKFLINGREFYFTGFGMHEDHETIGKGHSNAHMVQDFELLSWIGANSLRTSHYPYAEEFMDYCDRHGIVVIDETPAVGLNWGITGGIIGGSTGGTYEEGHVDAGTAAQHRLEIERLIARDKNHPCVVLWSIANEPDTAVPEARDYFEPLVELTRELDPTRPVGYVNVMFAPYDRCTISDLFDVLMLNRYWGWYVNSGDLESAEINWTAELEGWTQKYPAKPIIITEYGADTVAGLHSIFDQPFTEDYQVAYLEMNSRVFDKFDSVIGEQMWNFADFQTKTGYARVDGNKKGAFTRDRRPKAAARYLRGRWHSLAPAAYGRRDSHSA
ncbi:Beta-glucuronidase [Corynebacterium occultum]|uniref:Beta-glucuronidase n=1 Tax=Corynebacterium occultum TaxID=2675219 RepID=A0A6B8VVG3_9CORY|nr:beta-glucuronidase [Corynebacterium occultum]QGU08133.1 Beta-glucuronidase [Corynebacterium occultum]